MSNIGKLVVLTPALSGLSREVDGSSIIIGRSDGCEFQIVEASISGSHCEVQLRGDELAVRDLGSTNGTHIQNQRITEAVLKPGQTLRLGDVNLRLELHPKPEAKITATKPAPPASSEPVVEPARKHHLLFVDDNTAFLDAFTGVCSALANKSWEIHTATTADRALAILQNNQIDLAVLDISMPILDGIQLLGIINRRYPGLKIAVMTGHATESNRSACLSNGAELFIEKPVAADGIKVVFNMLDDLILWSQREGFSGTLRHVGLQEVLQMECLGRHSSILEVRDQRTNGQIYIEVGSIIHAAAGPLLGEKALYKLLSLDRGVFRLQPFKAPTERTLTERWETLLMEAARIRDEELGAAAQKKSLPAVSSDPNARESDAQPAKTTPSEADTEFMSLGDDIVVVATYDGGWHPVGGSKS